MIRWDGWRRFALGSGRDRETDSQFKPAWLSGLILAFCAATIALVWFGSMATREWVHSTELLLERRAAEALALVRTGLSRDMKGAWIALLVPLDQRVFGDQAPYDLLQTTAKAFARFPYAESFLLWKRSADAEGVTYVFERTDRLPPWQARPPSLEPFPVTMIRDPEALRPVVDQLRRRTAGDRRDVLVHTSIDGTSYQIIARLFVSESAPHTLIGFGAIAINLDWVRHEYFSPFLRQVASIGGDADGLSFSIVDDQGRQAGTSGAAGTGRTFEHTFPPIFTETSLTALPRMADAIPPWTISVRTGNANPLAAVQAGADRLFALIVVAAVVSMTALLLMVRTVRARAAVASMKSEFVSTVTHELKTPLALIRLVGDTLARGRYTSTETIGEYAALLSQEAYRLTQSIDNLLTYARYSSTEVPARLMPVDLRELTDDALVHFRPRLNELGFSVDVDVAADLPHVVADRAAMLQVVENVIDNAIKYSGDARDLKISASAEKDAVTLRVADRGIGIAADDLDRVCERFFRGKNVRSAGSGLGLAIARRVVDLHRGTIAIRSSAKLGTCVDITLSAATHDGKTSTAH